MNPTLEAIIIVVPVLLISMSLHEMMHALVSYKLGDPTAYLMGRISLNPARHIDPWMTLALPILLVISHSPVIFGAAKPVQVNFHRVRYGEFGGALIGISGPLTNLVLAVISAGLLHLWQTPPDLAYKILGYSVLVNTGFFVFNSIPWPPLDGSRLLYAFAPEPLQEVMNSIERMGLAGLALFVLLFYQFLGPLVGHIVSWMVNGLVPGIL